MQATCRSQGLSHQAHHIPACLAELTLPAAVSGSCVENRKTVKKWRAVRTPHWTSSRSGSPYQLPTTQCARARGVRDLGHPCLAPKALRNCPPQLSLCIFALSQGRHLLPGTVKVDPPWNQRLDPGNPRAPPPPARGAPTEACEQLAVHPRSPP